MLARFKYILQQVMLTTLKPLFLPLFCVPPSDPDPWGLLQVVKLVSDGSGPKKQQISSMVAV